MKTNQPVWKFHANLGDANPIEHGGYFVFMDETGVYPPECAVIITPEDTGRETWEVRRFGCDPCTFVDGVLSDNRFHPSKPAWFADKLAAMADCFGQSPESVIALFTSADPIPRAEAWRMVGEYFGWDNLDSYPLFLTREEIEAKYSAVLAAI